MSPYVVLMNDLGYLHLRDVRDGIDMSDFKGIIRSSWKKIATNSQRRYYNCSKDLSEGTHILSYPDKSVEVVNVDNGDYVKPGYDLVSQSIESIITGWSGNKCKARCRIVPLHSKVLYPDVYSNRGIFTIYSGRNAEFVRGWGLRYTGTGSTRVSYGDEGIMVSSGGSACVILTQTLCKEVISGVTSLRIKCVGAEFLMIDTERLTRDPEEDHVWVWTGDDTAQDRMLVVGVGMNPVKEVEFLDD